MKNHYYCDYLNNDQFLKTVAEYTADHGDNFDDIKEAIRREVSMLINSAHGDVYDINDYLAQAKSLLEVLRHINDEINGETE
jgi:hypothetical protein